MYEKIEHCPICNSKQIGNYQLIKDFSVSQELFNISMCMDCLFKFTNPRPDKANIGKYYESEDYISHSNKAVNPIQVIYKIVRKYALKNKLNLINKFSEKGTLLDYGCGTGHFLQTCQKDGWKITGIEPDTKANALAVHKTNSTILTDISQIKPNQHFNIITLWHVLEHVHDLNGIMNTLQSILNKSGIILIAVPNIQSFDAEIYKEHWAAWDVPRHLYHFTSKDIKTLAKKHKLKVKDIVPMKFDAYYVSYLSEEYKNKSFFKLNKYFLGAINGYKSNLKANLNNQYSSLIYILTK